MKRRQAMRIALLWVLCMLVGAINVGTSNAHFLFVRLVPPAEAGRFAEVYFSDQADAGDPRFIDNIASTKLWLQAKPGSFEALTVRQTPDRLRAFIPASGGICVVGEC